MSVILLDLNYTLIENSRELPKPWQDPDYEAERYDQDLVRWLWGKPVALVTFRHDRHAGETIENIKRKTGWSPTSWHFNETGARVVDWKRHVLRERILPAFPRLALLALESNTATRQMYADHGVVAVRKENRDNPALTAPINPPAWSYTREAQLPKQEQGSTI